MKNDFKFLAPNKLVDDDLELVLLKKIFADERKGWVPAYEFEMINTLTDKIMGLIRLRVGNNENIYYGGNVGYEVSEKFRGHNYAARSLKLLFSFAKQNGSYELWVTCNPENIASRKTCELAGGKLMEIVDLPEYNDQYKLGERKKCRYRFEI